MKTRQNYILIVEDDAAHAEAIQRALAFSNPTVEIQIVGTLHEYHESVADKTPDIALIDLNLPDGKAFELLSSAPSSISYPILVMTSFGNEQTAVKALKAGALDYIVKSSEVFAEIPHRIEHAMHEWEQMQERKHMEMELHDAYWRIESIIEGTHVGTWEWNVQTGETIFNEVWAQIIGYTLDELLPTSIKTWEMVTHPEDLKQSNELLERHFKGELPYYDCECRVKHKDGSWVWIHDRGRVITRSGDGKPLMMFGTHTDISTRKQAEYVLRASEEQFRAIYSQSPIAIELFDATGRLIDVNAACLDLFGVDDPQSLKGFDLFSDPNVAPGYLEQLKEGKSVHYQTAFDFEIVRSLNLYFTKRSGIIWLDVLISSLAGSSIGYLVQIQDISERIQAENALHSSEEKYRIIFNNEIYAICIFDLETLKLLDVNDAYIRLYGYSKEELISGMTIHDITAQHQVSDAATNQARHEGTIFIPIRYHRKKDGSIFPVEIVGGPYQWNEREVMFAMAHDISERELKDEVQRKTQNLLTVSQRLAHIGSWETELSTGKLSWSDEMYYIFGFPAAMPIYLDMALSVFPPDELVRFREAVASAIRGDAPYNIDYTIIRYDGQVRIIHNEAEVVFDENGNPVRMFGTTQDITAHKQAEKEKEKLQEQLLQAQKMESVGRLAGGVAHDFNNMLGIIMGYTEFAMTKISPEHKSYHALQEISKAAGRSANLTNQLLAYARKQIVSPIILDLNDTVSSMFNMLQRLLGEDIDMLWRPASHLWQIKVDPSHIDQIMVNLLVNARDAIDTQGKIMIETDNVVLGEADYAHYIELTPGEYVLLTVRDNGGGMDRETLANIFEPFYTTKEVGKGSGMGLATVYGIVKQNNGNIYVYSELGQGTTFKIYLPRADAVSFIETTVGETATHGTETVLLVEDEEALLELGKDTLEELGYIVLAANTPNDALRLAKEHRGEIDLLFSDVVMPGMNGRLLAEQVKAICPRLKCLFMSGYTADIIAKHGILEEDVYFIQKPFSLTTLAVKIRQILEKT